jgi:hypothetical protein
VIDLAELKDYIGEPSNEFDTLLSTIEKAVVDYVERETGRTFSASASHVEVLDGAGTIRLWISEEPSSLTSLETRSGVNGAWETVETGDYELQGRQVIRIDGGVWTSGIANYRATYAFGYATNAQPAEIRQAVRDLVRNVWRNRNMGVTQPAAFVSADEIVTDFKIPASARRVLNRWRIPVV